MRYFHSKISKIAQGGAPRPPLPPEAGGFASRPPASGGWGLRLQTLNGLLRLGAPTPLPPPLRNPGYATVSVKGVSSKCSRSP